MDRSRYNGREEPKRKRKDVRILTHPTIPKPLHSINPRSIFGQDWWDRQRKWAYAEAGFKCEACGVHKSKADYHQWLEAHEMYDIDYKKGTVTFTGIKALCHSCHNFIHSGRLLAMVEKGETEEEKALDIIQRGMRALREKKLKPPPMARYVELYFKGFIDEDIERAIRREYKNEMNEDDIPWSEWKMIIEGKEYFSPFKNMEEWEEFYQVKTSNS